MGVGYADLPVWEQQLYSKSPLVQSSLRRYWRIHGTVRFREKVTMQQTNEGRPVLIIAMIAVVILLLLGASFGAVLLATNQAGIDDSLPSPSVLAAAVSTASPMLSETGAAPSLSATSSPTLAPLPTLPEPSATLAPPTPPPPSPTLAPPTPPPPPPAPTLVPPTATPSVSISVVRAPRAFVYDGPSSNNSIIGGVEQGDELVVLGRSGTWYLVRVSGAESPRSRIEGGQGWIAQDLVGPPSQPVPVITP